MELFVTGSRPLQIPVYLSDSEGQCQRLCLFKLVIPYFLLTVLAGISIRLSVRGLHRSILVLFAKRIGIGCTSHRIEALYGTWTRLEEHRDARKVFFWRGEPADPLGQIEKRTKPLAADRYATGWRE